tara:strand:+ start:336 stop:626 length:291 start_codon:yes stop_codon:yes gene_type:complete
MTSKEESIRIVINSITNLPLEKQKEIGDFGQFLLFSGIYLNDHNLVRNAIDNFPEEANPSRSISNKTIYIFGLCGITFDDLFPNRSSSPTSILQNI